MPITSPPSAPPAAPDAPGDAPSRANPSTFRTLADSFVVWQVGFRDSVADLRDWFASLVSWASTAMPQLDALQSDVATKSTAAVAAAAAAAHIYAGTYSSAPTTRPDGSAIQNGDRYQNSADGQEYVRLSGVWTSAISLTLGSARVQKTWAELAAITGSVPSSAVIFDDTGTHTDPVVGGTVNNAGVYRWSASPAGWERVANTDAVQASGEYRIYVTGTPVPLGGYVAARTAPLPGRMRRYYVETTGGAATVQAKVNGVVVATGVNVNGTQTQDVNVSVPKGATIDFWVTAGTPTSVWAQLDAATP